MANPLVGQLLAESSPADKMKQEGWAGGVSNIPFKDGAASQPGSGGGQGLVPQLHSMFSTPSQNGQVQAGGSVTNEGMQNGVLTLGGVGKGRDAGGWAMEPPQYADGGDPQVGVPAIVGEKGPELIVPKVPTTVIPAEATAEATAALTGSLTGSQAPSLKPMIPSQGQAPQPIQPQQTQMGSISTGLTPLTQPQVDPRKVLEESLLHKITKYENNAQGLDENGNPIHRGFWGKLGHTLAQSGFWQDTRSEVAKRNAEAERVNLYQGLAHDDQTSAKAQSTAPITITPEMAQARPGLAGFVGESIPASTLQKLIDATERFNSQESIAGDKDKTGLAEHGLRLDEQGRIVPDPDSPYYQTQQLKENTLKAQADNMNAQAQLREAQEEVERAKLDPTSAAFKLAQQKLEVASRNANAAQTRANAYMGNYLQGAYNTSNPAITGGKSEILPGATMIADENGNQVAVGSRNAGAAVKAQSNVAQFKDVYGSSDRAEDAAQKLSDSGGELNSVGIAMAMAQPRDTIMKWLQGEVAKKNLNELEREYVTEIVQLHENVQALRKSAGGIATDASVDKLDHLIPDASTPDIKYFKNQLETLRQTANRLSKGVTTAHGGLTVKNNGSNPNNTPQRPAGVPANAVWNEGAKQWQLQQQR